MCFAVGYRPLAFARAATNVSRPTLRKDRTLAVPASPVRPSGWNGNVTQPERKRQAQGIQMNVNIDEERGATRHEERSVHLRLDEPDDADARDLGRAPGLALLFHSVL